MLSPELANPFSEPRDLDPDTAKMVEDMLGKEARKAFEALDDEPKRPKEKPQELTEKEKAAMRQAQERLERSREKKEFPTWKTIPLGEYKTVEEFISALNKGGFKIGKFAHEILWKTPLFGSPTSVELVDVSAEDLGLEGQVTLQEIYDRARELGLSLCPSEVGPALRLHYSDQPNELKRVAMKPISDFRGVPRVFEVISNDNGRWLETTFHNLDDIWDAGYKWLFFRSKKK